MTDLETAYTQLDRNSALYFDAYLPITEMENGQDISQWPTRIMIANQVLSKEAELSSFGDERKMRVDLSRRLKALREYRIAKIERCRAITRRLGLVGMQYS
jgi:hypothetical protein